MGEDQEVVVEAKVEAERTTMTKETVLARNFHLTENKWLLTYRPEASQSQNSERGAQDNFLFHA